MKIKNNLYLTFLFLIFLLTFGVMQLGALTRLKDAGLGCPDWPGCYGSIIPSKKATLTSQISNSGKAWAEMIHRYAAGTLGVMLIGLIIFLITRNSSEPVQKKYAFFLISLLILQILLGKWTVTWKLFPVIVVAHLCGGLSILSCTLLLILQKKLSHRTYLSVGATLIKRGGLLGLIIVALQFFLGGWTSSHYAAFVCPDFPTCQGKWLAPMDFTHAFMPIFSHDLNYEYGILSLPARTAIQFTHRIGAIITFAYTLIYCTILFYTHNKFLKKMATLLICLVVSQFCLGVLNVVYLLPLGVALAHNGVALFLFLTYLIIYYYVNAKLI